MRKIKNEDITRMVNEMLAMGQSPRTVSNGLKVECIRLGGEKGLTPERIRQLSKGGALGAGSVIYEKAIFNLHKRICK